MLSESHQSAILQAVPSFEPVWRHWTADQAEYVSRFPEEALTASETGSEFLWQLARHLGGQIAGGDLAEVEPLFAALDAICAVADADLWSELTVGFLESLIYSIEYRSGEPRAVHAVAKGPAAEEAWRAAFAYIHPAEAEALGWHEV